MSKSYILLAAAFALTLTSCFKEEALNNECDIEEARIEVANPDEVFFQPSDAVLLPTSEQKTVVFPSLRPNSDLTAIPVYFKLTEGATISPESGSAQDFTNGPVEYVVTSEDHQWSRTYTVNITAKDPEPEPNPDPDPNPNPNPDPDEPEVLSYVNYDFEKYALESTASKYYEWSDYEVGNNWATGNPGFKIAKSKAKPEEYPTTPLAEGYEGAGVKLTTSDTGAFGKVVNMPIAAGNLFLGVFDSKTATKAPLKATHFGDGAYSKINYQPVTFSGYYQYTPGTDFHDKDGNSVSDRIDKGDIYAVVFRNVDADGNAFYLTGDNVLTSSQIVALARVPNVDKTEGGWQKFSLDFNYTSTLDPEVLAKYGYSMTIVFTSSKGGAEFEGAIGSTLLIDKVSVGYKK